MREKISKLESTKGAGFSNSLPPKLNNAHTNHVHIALELIQMRLLVHKANAVIGMTKSVR